MADKIRIRMYNVHFGDAILITVPDRNTQGEKLRRHVLVDVGNVLNKDGGDDAVFKPVIDDIISELDGKPIDLYVMTHEHLDHVQGLYYAATKAYPPGQLQQMLRVDYAWLTASADSNYYDAHPAAKKKKAMLLDAYWKIDKHLQALPVGVSQPFGALMANNNPRTTAECVDFLRKLAPANRTHYVYRGFDTTGKHPFRDATFEIWAPEEDTSSYYRSLLPMDLEGDSNAPGTSAATNVPPPGVDAGAFYDLIEWRAGGFVDNILAIDKAANNTSVVFALVWRGKRLLFSGDAEIASWRMMQEQNVFKTVDFLKVSHHGSHNGTPDNAILDAFLPKGAASKRKAAISTWNDTYSGIPHGPTNARLNERCKLETMLDHRNDLFYDVEIAS